MTKVDEGDLLKNGFVSVRFLNDDEKKFNKMKSESGSNCVMVESPTFFAAYSPVLKQLNLIENMPTVPFHNFLVSMKDFVQNAQWVNYKDPLKLESKIMNFVVKKGFDSSQLDAFKMAVKNKLSVIGIIFVIT